MIRVGAMMFRICVPSDQWGKGEPILVPSRRFHRKVFRLGQGGAGPRLGELVGRVRAEQLRELGGRAHRDQVPAS
jgi:hypothetical protein